MSSWPLDARPRQPVPAFLDCGLLHWTGRAWRQSAYPHPAAGLQSQPVAVAAVSRDDTWLLGYTYKVATQCSGGFIDRWNGRRWRRAALPASAVASIPGGGAWIAGATGDNTGETGNTPILPLLARRF